MSTNRVTGRTDRRASARQRSDVAGTRRGHAANRRSAGSAFRLDQFRFEVLYLLGEERTIRLDLLAALLGVDPSVLRPVVGECVSAGLLKQKAFLRDEPANYPWVWMTREGLHAAGARPQYYYVPPVGALEHLLGVHKIRLFYMLHYPDWTWVPERELLDRHNRAQRHLADGALERDGILKPVEYERTRKDRIKVVRNLSELVVRYGDVDVYCSDETRGFITAIRDAAGLDGVRVLDLPEFAGIA